MSNLSPTEAWAKKLGTLPGVAAIFLSGSRAQGRDNPESDIDFFVITEPGRIWTARFFVFVFLKARKKLAKPHHHAGMICPNHFITSDNLEIAEKDAYSANLFSHNQPLYDPHDLFPKFIAANHWVHDFKETFTAKPITTKPRNLPQITWTKHLVELLLKRFQMRIVKKNPEYQTPGAKIILSDKELRFHPKPRNKEWSK